MCIRYFVRRLVTALVIHLNASVLLILQGNPALVTTSNMNTFPDLRRIGMPSVPKMEEEGRGELFLGHLQMLR